MCIQKSYDCVLNETHIKISIQHYLFIISFFFPFIAPCVENVQGAVEYIFPLVYEFKTIKPAYRNNDKLDSSVFMNRNQPCLNKPKVEESDLSDEDSVNQMDSDASCG